MNDKINLISKFKKKINELKAHNKHYFSDDNPIINDREYDDLKKELEK